MATTTKTYYCVTSITDRLGTTIRVTTDKLVIPPHDIDFTSKSGSVKIVSRWFNNAYNANEYANQIKYDNGFKNI